MEKLNFSLYGYEKNVLYMHDERGGITCFLEIMQSPEKA